MYSMLCIGICEFGDVLDGILEVMFSCLWGESSFCLFVCFTSTRAASRIEL